MQHWWYLLVVATDGVVGAGVEYLRQPSEVAEAACRADADGREGHEGDGSQAVVEAEQHRRPLPLPVPVSDIFWADHEAQQQHHYPDVSRGATRLCQNII